MSATRAASVSVRGSDTLVARVRRAISDLQLIRRHDRVVVGVSGGLDSVTLLHLLVRLRPSMRLTVYAVHVDHQLRAESGEDASFVQELTARLNVPVVVDRRDMAALCRREGWSLEDGARRIRYQCFVEAAARYSARVVALAHTADDQAETVLMRLLRGSGLTGLAGIPVAREIAGVHIVRPLLHCWRQELAAYLTRVGLTHRDDASNTDRRFVRNRIRHELLPLLARDYNPNIKAALVQLAGQSRVDHAYLQSAAQRYWKRVARATRSGDVSLKLPTLARQPEALQRELVRQALRQIRGDLNQFEFRHWRELERLMQAPPARAAVHLPGGVQVIREADQLRFQPPRSSTNANGTCSPLDEAVY
ncbi:MAG: tRNA lysidine(34) synthetase TilS [Candidatus Omnitrophota bacterium]|nr:tRNA lysidine(34) synthetase TilS [Candidatus Omnitrophota bacterium]